jgi:hypothetical protein
LQAKGRTRRRVPRYDDDEARRPRCEALSTGSGLLLAALTRESLQRALKRVRASQGAAGAAQSYVQSGRRIVGDVDLEKVFDRVDHDILIARLQKRIGDPGGIRLIRADLNSGVLEDGRVQQRTMGTPQGGPLSPLLANVLLDEVDKGLERRGHGFVRYADGCERLRPQPSRWRAGDGPAPAALWPTAPDAQ